MATKVSLFPRVALLLALTAGVAKAALTTNVMVSQLPTTNAVNDSDRVLVNINNGTNYTTKTIAWSALKALLSSQNGLGLWLTNAADGGMTNLVQPVTINGPVGSVVDAWSMKTGGVATASVRNDGSFYFSRSLITGDANGAFTCANPIKIGARTYQWPSVTGPLGSVLSTDGQDPHNLFWISTNLFGGSSGSGGPAGTQNQLAMFTTTNSLGDSMLDQIGTNLLEWKGKVSGAWTNNITNIIYSSYSNPTNWEALEISSSSDSGNTVNRIKSIKGSATFNVYDLELGNTLRIIDGSVIGGNSYVLPIAAVTDLGNTSQYFRTVHAGGLSLDPSGGSVAALSGYSVALDGTSVKIVGNVGNEFARFSRAGDGVRLGLGLGNGQFLMGSSSGSFAAADTFLGMGAAVHMWQLGTNNASDTAPVSAQTLHGIRGSGTDVKGGDLVLAGGISTGKTNSGDLYLATSGKGTASSTTLNSLTNRVKVEADTGNVTIYSNLTVNGTAGVAVTAGNFTGNGVGLTNIPASGLNLPSYLMTNGNSQPFILFTNNQVAVSLKSGGTISGTNYAGSGQGFQWSTNGIATASLLTAPNYEGYQDEAGAFNRTIAKRAVTVSGSGSSYGIVGGFGFALRLSQVTGGSDQGNASNASALLSNPSVGNWLFDTNGIFKGSVTATNGLILPQLTNIPTNSVPASSAGVTNYILCNFTNSLNGTSITGGPYYVATNIAAAGSFLLLAPTLTATTYP